MYLRQTILMNKILLIITIISAIGCGKSKNDPYPAFGTFTIGEQSYTATTFDIATSVFYAGTGLNGNDFRVDFLSASLPIAAGSYPIVSSNYKGKTAAALVRGRYYITASTHHDYYSTGNDGTTCEVSYENGKMVIRVPKVWCVRDVASNDSTQVSANLKQLP